MVNVNNIGFGWKFATPVVIVLVVISALFMSVLATFEVQRQINGNLTQVIAPATVGLLRANHELYQVRAASLQALIAQDQQQLNALRATLTQTNARLAENLALVQPVIDQGLVGGDSRQLLSALQQDLTSLQALYQQHLWQVPMDQLRSNYLANQTQIDQNFARVERNLGQLLGLIAQSQGREGAALANASERTVARVLWGWPLVTLVGLALMALTIRLTLKPLKQMRDAMQDIASGQGDLRQRLPVLGRDELNQLSLAFNDFMVRMHETVTLVNGSMVQTQAQTSRIFDINGQLFEVSNSQKDQNNQVATAITELNASANEVARRAQEAAQSSDLAAGNTSKARATIEQAQHSMRELSKEIEQASTVIHALEQSVESIVSILDVIRGIADQTNLLALNAAIEAARAGEQGRGFAVVADEVRSLASKTQDSTGEIQSMIAKLQSGSEHAVQAMQRSKAGSDQTFEQVAQAVDALTKVSEAIDRINDMNTQIASAASQQSVVSDDINQNVQHIANGAEDMVGHVQASGQSADALVASNNELRGLIGRFKV